MQEYLDVHLKQIPLQRYGRIDEIASASTYLFSPAATYVTGTTLVVDGADVSLSLKQVSETGKLTGFTAAPQYHMSGSHRAEMDPATYQRKDGKGASKL